MYKEQTITSFGSISIHKKVIASIASIAALQTEGVSRLAPKFIFNKLNELLGKKQDSSIRVYINKNGEISLNIPLVIKYDYNIPEVAYRVQENVMLSLERMTSMMVKQINIIIKGVERSEK